jgi:3-deoxy-D-manno-octulosonic-acid transferase
VRLAELRAAIGPRPVLLAASTHPGEDALILAAGRELAPRFPDLLTILVPRHPERGAEIAALANDAPRRGAGARPGPGPVYIADTIGELGLFYRVASVALIGGSLIPHGGQNPLEAARLGCPVILGPHMENFSDATAALLVEGGVLQLPDAAALAAVVADMLSHPERAAGLGAAATRVVSAASDLPGRMAGALLDLLSGKAAGKA